MEVQTSSSENDSQHPPFPNDVPTAPLLRISLQKLLNNDELESGRLFTACKDLGFFYLDLRNTSEGKTILRLADELFNLGNDLYDLNLEEKEKYDFSAQNSYFGYKGYGKAVVDKDGTLDRNEFYNISKDDILSPTPTLPAPPLLHHARPLLKCYILTSHSIITHLLSHLNIHLHLPPSTLQNLHLLASPSGDQVRLIKAPPQHPSDSRTALGAHTDYGSLTLLFNRLGGLQVLSPGSDSQWSYVRPLPDHAIVNLGDAMVKFSNGLLRSNIHRVVAPPGAQGRQTRYSLVYFSRPGDEVLLRRLEGSGGVIPELGEGEGEEEVCAKEWIIRKAMEKRVGSTKEGREEGGPGTEEGWEKSRIQ